jgi:SagB-type dehydrogenase family enzyme
MPSSPNRETSAARRYHAATSHTFWSVRTGGRELDWPNMPRPFKIYPSLDPIPLPRDFPPTALSALAALARPPLGPSAATPTLAQLAALLYFSAGITRRRAWPGGEIYFRAAACTGALYEIELYIVTGSLDGLEAGLYHFSPAEFALRLLRPGDWRGVLSAATAAEPAVAQAPVLLVSTGIYWRNAWKYGPRTYRHFGWDNGTLHANLLAMAAAQNLPARLVLGFEDGVLDRLLALDTEKEAALAIVALGAGAEMPPAAREIPLLSLETVPPSAEEIDYPEMRAMHAATVLSTADEVAAWRVNPAAEPAPPPPCPQPAPGHGQPNRTVILTEAKDRELSSPSVPPEPLEEVIRRRGSTRRFARQPITLAELSTALDLATRPIPADFLAPAGAGARLNDLYVIANAVDGLESGSYFFGRDPLRLELLKSGNFRDTAQMLGLEQALPGDAAAAVFFLADLERILARFGNRGYRAAQLEAGILGGRLYLAAYAQHFGATGLTFYDDEVVAFFSPHAAGKDAIFFVALGRSAKSLPTL